MSTTRKTYKYPPDSTVPPATRGFLYAWEVVGVQWFIDRGWKFI